MRCRQLRFGALPIALLAAPGTGAAQERNASDDPFEVRTLTGRTASASPERGVAGEICFGDGGPKAGRSLIDVIIQALCHNPQTRQAWINARIQAAQVGVDESAYLPSIFVNTQISTSKNFSGGSLASPIQTTGVAAGLVPVRTRVLPILTLNYLLFDVGGRAARLESARHALEAANWTHDLSIQIVLIAAVQAYYQMFAAEAARIAEASSAAALADELQAKEEEVALQEAKRDQLQQSVGLDVWSAYYNERTTRETLESAEALPASADPSESHALDRYNARAGDILDVLSTQASLANARFRRMQAQFNWAIGKARLARAIGRLDLHRDSWGTSDHLPASGRS